MQQQHEEDEEEQEQVESINSSTVINVLSDDRENKQGEEDEEPYNIHIRFTTGHTLHINLRQRALSMLEGDNSHLPSMIKVTQLKQIIKQELTLENETGMNAGQYSDLITLVNEKPIMRLIYNGKLMMDMVPLKFYKVKNECFIHCALSDLPNNDNSPHELERELSSMPRGFDRLIPLGFSNEDVQYIRNEFYSSRQYLLAQYETGQLTIRDLQNLEEQWMNEDYDPLSIANANVDNNNNLNNNNNGNDTTVQNEMAVDFSTLFNGSNYYAFIGMFIGFYLTLMASLLLLEQASPRKFKYGIVAGIVCNFSFATLKFFL
jgi:hypothetical protein